ncbi:MAG TPA: hypothetical protein VFV39_01870 [Limnobacter sp.]|nr:hypothetical protein [Limnobacter sp.]
MAATALSFVYTPGAGASGAADEAQPDAGASHLGTAQVDGKTYYYFKSGNDRVYMFESAEDRQTFIENMCLRMGIPVSEAHTLKSYDIKDFLPRGPGVEKRNGNIGIGTGIVTFVSPQRVASLDTEADADFFGEGVPAFPPDVKPFLDNRENIVFTGDPVNDGRLLAGIQGAAASIYAYNYGNLPTEQNPLVNLGQLDDGIEDLASRIFGIPKEQITQGHLNTMRIMGLIDGGSVDAGGAGALKLSTAGSQLLSVWTGSTPPAAFVPSPNTFINPGALNTYQSMFNEDGTLKTKPGGSAYTLAEVAAAVKALLPAGSTDLPASVKPSQEVLDLGERMFGLDPNTNKLSVEQVNALIAAGLVTYDPTTGNVAITPKGSGLPTQ